MGILPPYYTSNATRKSKPKAKSAAALAHEAWLAARGLDSKTLSRKKVVDKNWKKQYTNSMKVDRSDYVSMGMSGEACFDKGIMNNLHKEPEHVRREILAKASRVMPLYNKGGLQYASPNEDMTMVGSKSRRG